MCRARGSLGKGQVQRQVLETLALETGAQEHSSDPWKDGESSAEPMTLRKQDRGRDSGLGKERGQLDLRSWKREQGSGSKVLKSKGDSVLRSRH